MFDYNILERVGRKGYASLVKKINDFYESEKRFPENLNEFALTNEDVDVLKHRGKLEKKLHKTQKSKLFLLQTFYKEDEEYFSDNDQLIFTDFGYRLTFKGWCKNDVELGLGMISRDVLDRRNNHCLMYLGTNARILFIRPKNWLHQLIRPNSGSRNPTHSGTLASPIYQIENILDTKEDILTYCEEKGLYKKNLRKVSSLFDRDVLDLLREEDSTKCGIIGVPRIIDEKLGFAY